MALPSPLNNPQNRTISCHNLTITPTDIVTYSMLTNCKGVCMKMTRADFAKKKLTAFNFLFFFHQNIGAELPKSQIIGDKWQPKLQGHGTVSVPVIITPRLKSLLR